MSDTIRWGILATGSIARQFAKGLTFVDGAELVAVGSRSQESADRFGEEFGVPHRHGSYEALAADPDVDAVYVAPPHPFHKDGVMLCLDGGKAVLCEKPFTMNAKEARELVDAARSKKLFLMEAMWTRFIPAIVKVRELLREDVIGETRLAQANFCFRADLNPASRLFAPELGGGGLLDVGVYVISLASMIFGEKPSRIASMAHIGETNVDEDANMILGYSEGRMANLTCAVRTTTPHDANIYGTNGAIRIHHPFWHADKLTVSVAGEEPREIAIPYEGNGYNFEAEEVGRCLRAGKLESAIMPLDETLAIMETMDEIRAQWGLTYPME